MRAARTTCTVAGTCIVWTGCVRRCLPRSPDNTLVSTRVRTVSSRKNGLPRLTSSCLSGVSPGSSPRSASSSSLALSAGRSNAGLAITHLSRGSFLEAKRLFEDVIARIPTEQTDELFGQARSPASTARSTLGVANAYLGQFTEALAHASQALRDSETAQHAYTISATLYSLGVIQLLKGDNAEAVRTLDRSLESWGVLQAPPWSSLSAALGVALCRTGDFPRGLSLLEVQTHSPGDVLYPTLLAQAEGYLLAGRTQQASGYAQQALDVARSTGSRGTEAIALRLLGETMACGDALDAQAVSVSGHYMAALSLATQLNMRPLVAHCHLGLAKMHRRSGKRRQTHEHLTIASAMHREMGMTYWLEQSEAGLRKLG